MAKHGIYGIALRIAETMRLIECRFRIQAFCDWYASLV